MIHEIPTCHRRHKQCRAKKQPVGVPNGKGHPARTLLADGFEKAFVGWFTRCGQPTVAVYDLAKCINILIKRDKMTRNEAEEFIEFNVTGAWCGEGTPAFMETGSIPELNDLLAQDD